MATKGRAASPLGRLPRAIWTLGFVSLLMDVSSEMIHAVLPLYLVVALGASMEAVGWIEGIAEATASITKLFSGALSDRLGKRKALAVAGYGLSALSKPIFPLAATIGWVAAGRFIDRVGKGVRGAPRDALVADIAPPHLRGAAFGLRQTLDTVGAFIGPLLAVLILWTSREHFQPILWAAFIPAILAVALLGLGVEEPAPSADGASLGAKPAFADWRRLGPRYWGVIALAAVFGLARFSEAFLILRAQGLGLPLALAPLVLVVMNVVYALAAYPAGALSDRTGRYGVLAFGVALLIPADVALAFAPGPGVEGLSVATLGLVLWGLHMGFTQGLFATLVADAAPPALRGAAFGVYNLVSGLAALASSALAGLLWQGYGAGAPFLAGAAFTAAALAGLAAFARR